MFHTSWKPENRKTTSQQRMDEKYLLKYIFETCGASFQIEVVCETSGDASDLLDSRKTSSEAELMWNEYFMF